MDEAQKEFFSQGVTAIQDWVKIGGTLGIVFSILHIITSLLVLAGGVAMITLRQYWLAITGSVVSLLPLFPCCILGLPFGIWSLVVLARPDVKAAFQATNVVNPNPNTDDSF